MKKNEYIIRIPQFTALRSLSTKQQNYTLGTWSNSKSGQRIVPQRMMDEWRRSICTCYGNDCYCGYHDAIQGRSYSIGRRTRRQARQFAGEDVFDV
jgi:hypothetical protein